MMNSGLRHDAMTRNEYNQTRRQPLTIESRILDLMAQRPTAGLTSSEIEEVTRHEVSAYSASSRLSALANRGVLRRGEKRRGPSGGVGTVYRLVDPRSAPPTLPGFEPEGGEGGGGGG